MKRSLLLSVLTFVLMMPATSHALVRFSLVGSGMKTSIITGSGTFLAPNGLGYGGGALLGIGTSGLTVEIGALYTVRRVKWTSWDASVGDNLVIALDSTGIQVPLVFRTDFLKVFSIGAGGYYTKYSKTKISAYYGKTPGTAVTATSDVSDSTDKGLVGSFAIYIPTGILSRFVIDARYNYGLVSSEKTREFQGLVGLSFGI